MQDYNKLSQCWRIDIGNVGNTLERRQTNQQGTNTLQYDACMLRSKYLRGTGD